MKVLHSKFGVVAFMVLGAEIERPFFHCSLSREESGRIVSGAGNLDDAAPQGMEMAMGSSMISFAIVRSVIEE